MAQTKANGLGGWAVAGLLFLALVSQCGKEPPQTITGEPPAFEAADTSTDPEWLYVQPASLNCRGEPSTSSWVAESLKLGDLVQVTTVENGWARIERPSPCWVRSMYLGSEKHELPPEPVHRREHRTAIQGFSSAGSGSVYYRNCAAARAAGAAPIRYGEPGYAAHLDRDGDGVACE